MKTQIRKNVFETNSSTQHTVTVCNENTIYSDYVGKTIVLGKNIDCDDILYNSRKKRNPVIKINQLWLSLLGSETSMYQFIKGINTIKSALNKIGINVELSTDPEDYKWADEHRWYGDIDDLNCVVAWVFNSEEDIVNYIFNQDSWYDSYEDDCGGCPYETEIKKGSKTEWHRG